MYLLQGASRLAKGVADALSVLEVVVDILRTPKVYDIYRGIVFLNVVVSCSTHAVLYAVIHYIPTFQVVTYFVQLLAFVGWSLPVYLLSLVYNGVHTNDALAAYIECLNPNNLRLRYGCYGDRYSRYVVNKFYYQVVVILITLETTLLSYIPHVGGFLDWSLASLVYSYYCWEYCWSSYKVPHSSRYAIFEGDWLYHLGYGALLGFIQCRCGFFVGYHLVSALYPLFSMRTLDKYEPSETRGGAKGAGGDKKPEGGKGLYLFWLPVRSTNRLVQWIARRLEAKVGKIGENRGK